MVGNQRVQLWNCRDCRVVGDLPTECQVQSCQRQFARPPSLISGLSLASLHARPACLARFDDYLCSQPNTYDVTIPAITTQPSIETKPATCCTLRPCVNATASSLSRQAQINEPVATPSSSLCPSRRFTTLPRRALRMKSVESCWPWYGVLCEVVNAEGTGVNVSTRVVDRSS